MRCHAVAGKVNDDFRKANHAVATETYCISFIKELRFTKLREIQSKKRKEKASVHCGEMENSEGLTMQTCCQFDVYDIYTMPLLMCIGHRSSLRCF